MCRLLGITNFNSAVHAELLSQFFGLAVTGAVPPGNAPGHADGWGIGWYVGAQARVEKSGASAQVDEERIHATLAAIGSSPVLIAHLRKSAWPDTSTGRHAHPFSLENYLFAHNGTVTDYAPLRAGISPRLAPPDDALDTEVLFRAVISDPACTMQAQFIDAIRTVKTLPYTALNILMSDGASLLAYRDCAKWPDYYTLYTAQGGAARLVCSEPLPAVGAWRPLDNGELAFL